MAYDDSGELPIASDPSEENIYNLGGYSFELEVQNVHEPGEPDVVSVFAICRSPDGTRETEAMDFPPGTTVTGWYVEANETEASVYAHIVRNPGEIDISPVTKPVAKAQSASGTQRSGKNTDTWGFSVTEGWITQSKVGWNRSYTIAASANPAQEMIMYYNGQEATRYLLSNAYTYNGYTVYWTGLDWEHASEINDVSPNIGYDLNTLSSVAKKLAWYMVYEDSGESEDTDKLIGRFAIDLHEADGGPDGDWDEPGSDGPPNKTLYVTVTGASTGSHSPTVFPLENSTIKGYGFGGDGGHGGGGGAGASTVIIYDFATSKADEVVQEAITKPPMAGSGGGKGGKGGDGCILIFY